jgi:hypothetical protein
MPPGTLSSAWAPADPSGFGQAFGTRQVQVTRIDTAGQMMGQLANPQGYTPDEYERVYLPPSPQGASPLGATGLAQFGRPNFPLPYNTTGIMWKGSHVSDVAIINGQITARVTRRAPCRSATTPGTDSRYAHLHGRQHGDRPPRAGVRAVRGPARPPGSGAVHRATGS